jgi:hypothetical protein
MRSTLLASAVFLFCPTRPEYLKVASVTGYPVVHKDCWEARGLETIMAVDHGAYCRIAQTYRC